MDFSLTEGQRKLVEAFRTFGEERFKPELVHQWRRDQGLPDEVVKGFVDLYFGLEDLADGDGPGAFSLCSQALIIEELSRCSGATLPFQIDLFNLALMGEFAAQSEFDAIVDDYRKTGRLMFALAISEPEAGSDSMNMQTSQPHGRRALDFERVQDVREQRGVRALHPCCGHRPAMLRARTSTLRLHSGWCRAI